MMRRAATTLVGMALALGGWPSPGQAQDGGQPLSKSELVRLVVTNAYSGSEKAALISNSCLSFVPTVGDWADIQALGAPDEVQSAIRGCAADDQPAPAVPPPPAPATLTVDLVATSVTTLAGDTATIVATVTRSGAAVTDLGVTLAPTSGPGRRPFTNRTGPNGRVTFRVPAGTRAGQIRYGLSAGGTRLSGETKVALSIRAATPALGVVSAEPVQVSVEQAPIEILASLTDRFDNPVAGAETSLKTDRSATGLLIASSTTNRDGVAEFSLDSAVISVLVGGGARQIWAIEFAGQPIGSVSVEVDADPAAIAAAIAGPAARTDSAPAPPVSSPMIQVGIPDPQLFNEEMSAGRAFLDEGNADSAAVHFRGAVSLDPTSAEAKKGLAAASVAGGDADEGVFWYQLATTADPTDVEAWLGLSQALARAGKNEESQRAYARAVELDPDLDVETETAASSTVRPPLTLGASAWGGSTIQTDGSGGFREATIRFDPSDRVALWGAYDDGLYRHEPWLVRGKDVVQAIGAGGAFSWNSQRLRTTVTIRSRDAGFSLQQNLFQLEQAALLSSGNAATELRIGGYLGRWYDGDDWLIYAQVGFGVSREVRIVPGLSTGKTFGSNLEETGRRQDRDTRLYVGVDWEKPTGLRITPTLGVGSVSSDVDAYDGTLFDALLDAEIPLGATVRALAFLHYQSPPGSEAFTTIAAGLKVGFDLNQ